MSQTLTDIMSLTHTEHRNAHRDKPHTLAINGRPTLIFFKVSDFFYTFVCYKDCANRKRQNFSKWPDKAKAQKQG